jgi:hypothetical protein
MAAKIVEIFAKNLPSVNANAGEAFAAGMEAYHCAFKAIRDSAMNYETTPDYLNGWNEIMVVQKEDLWIHTPHFRKIVGLAIGELFRTKITMLAPPWGADISQHTMVLVDAYSNRWIMSVLHSEKDSEQIRICLRFPRSGTKAVPHALKSTENELAGADFNTNGLALVVYDTSVWHDAA